MRLSKLFVKTATLRDGPTFHTLYGFLTVENKASCILINIKHIFIDFTAKKEKFIK